MRVDLFDFALPDELIAQRPAAPRDQARLLDQVLIGAKGDVFHTKKVYTNIVSLTRS